jgi:chromate reductase
LLATFDVAVNLPTDWSDLIGTIMNTPLIIMGIPGSLRKSSFNRAALRAAQQLTPAGVVLEIVEIDGIPAFSEDLERLPPQPVADLKARIRAADAVLFATPEYNYSIPGVLKNAIDWASRPYGDGAWQGKPAAVMGASVTSFGSVLAQHDLRQLLARLGMHVLHQPEVAIAQAHMKFDARERLTDPVTSNTIRQLLEQLAAWTRRLQVGDTFPNLPDLASSGVARAR